MPMALELYVDALRHFSIFHSTIPRVLQCFVLYNTQNKCCVLYLGTYMTFRVFILHGRAEVTPAMKLSFCRFCTVPHTTPS